jgi:hypothetical protein
LLTNFVVEHDEPAGVHAHAELVRKLPVLFDAGSAFG